MCDTVAVIEKGRILATGTVQDILEGLRQRRLLSLGWPARRRVERFLLEQPGIYNVHEAGGRVQFEFEGGDDGAGGADRPARCGRYPGARVQRRRARISRICFIEITEGRAVQ